MNTQKKIALVALIIIGLVFGGVYFYYQSNPSITTDTDTDGTDAAVEVQEPLSESDILTASYSFSANFGGDKTPNQNVTFPSGTGAAAMSGVVYFDAAGKVLSKQSDPTNSTFVITKYAYTYPDKNTEAEVFITGTSDQVTDTHVFLVKKVGGKVITKEEI
jgi:hypothetical protein